MTRVLYSLRRLPDGDYEVTDYTGDDMNFHPLVRIAARRSLHRNISSNDSLTGTQRETLESIYENEDGAFDALVYEIIKRRIDMPMDGQRALFGVTPVDVGAPHPFIDWLSHGGFAWLYSVAQIIANLFGWNLPPLPPIPVPPPVPTP
jgi:hypothetical protein